MCSFQATLVCGDKRHCGIPDVTVEQLHNLTVMHTVHSSSPHGRAASRLLARGYNSSPLTATCCVAVVLCHLSEQPLYCWKEVLVPHYLLQKVCSARSAHGLQYFAACQRRLVVAGKRLQHPTIPGNRLCCLTDTSVGRSN